VRGEEGRNETGGGHPQIFWTRTAPDIQ